MIGCQKNNRTRQTHQYFDYLANLDPRVFAYYLSERVDITNFNVKAERYTNQETATQKMKSLHVENFHMAFWSKFIQNEIHNYGKSNDQRSVTKKVDDWAQRVTERLNSKDTKVSIRDIMLHEIKILREQVDTSEKKPFWQFMVTKSDCKVILNHLNSIINNTSDNINEEVKNDAREARFHLELAMKAEQFHLDFSATKLIRKLISKHERSKYMHYYPVTFKKEDFYRKLYLPFQDAHPVYDRSSKIDCRGFWKNTMAILDPDKTLFDKRKSSADQRRIMPRLHLIEQAFAERVLGKKDYFYIESQPQRTNKRKAIS